MKKTLTLLLILLVNLFYSQAKFEKGYFINNSNEKIECYILNYDWKFNPIEIEVKQNLEAEKKTLTINDINEFGIYEKSKYIKKTIEVNESKKNFQSLNYDTQINLIEKIVFLKVLTEGKSNLYYFENNLFENYFYLNPNTNNIELLLYKQFINDENKFIEINTYKQQLYLNFYHEKNRSKINYLKYNTSILNYFEETNKYYSTKNDSIFKVENKKIKIQLTPFVLINKTNQNNTFYTGSSFKNYNSENSISFTGGFEVEINFPFNNQSWSFIFEPQYIKNSFTYNYTMPYLIKPNKTFSGEVKIIRFPFGIRKYISFNNNNKIFINSSLNYNIINSDYNIYEPQKNVTNLSLSFGLGYQYKRILMELKYFLPTESYYFTLETDRSHKLNQLSLKLGYKFL